MTEFESRRKGTKTVAWIVVIALVVGIGGGWLIGALTSSGGGDKPGSVYVATANEGSLVGGLLTLKAVGNTVAKVDTDTRAAEASDAAVFFKAWDQTFGTDARSAVVIATSPAGDVQLVLKVTNADFSDIGYVLQFDAEVVSGPSEVRELTNVTFIVDGD